MSNQEGKVYLQTMVVMSILVIPIAVCSLFKLFHYAWSHRSVKEVVPLIIVEANTIYVWFCLGYSTVYIKTANPASYNNTAIYL